MYNITMDFDVDNMLEALKRSPTYDEFRIYCDVNCLEVIITRDEFDYIRK